MNNNTPTHNTLISLREYVDIRFDAQEKATNAAMAASDRAVNKAEMASEKRFDAVNEFREALADSARLLMPRAEAEQRINAITASVADLKQSFDNRSNKDEGKDQGFWKIAAMVSLLANIVLTLFYLSKAHP